jgi:hypothetical protein
MVMARQERQRRRIGPQNNEIRLTAITREGYFASLVWSAMH